MKAKSVRLPELKTDGFGFAASIEGGRALQSGGLTIEPQAQLIFQTVSLDRVADVAAQVRFDDMESLAGRLGVRVAKTWAEGDQNAVTLWGRANLWYEFMGDTRSEFSSAAGFVPLHADLGGEWVELNAGVAAEITNSLSVHANVTYETDFGGDLRAMKRSWDQNCCVGKAGNSEVKPPVLWEMRVGGMPEARPGRACADRS